MSDWTKWPLVDVLKRVPFRTANFAKGGYSNKYYLTCGHVVFAKGSDGTAKRKRCRSCYHDNCVDFSVSEMRATDD